MYGFRIEKIVSRLRVIIIDLSNVAFSNIGQKNVYLFSNNV